MTEQAKRPERAIRAYRRKWREITGVNPPHEGNTTHEHALAAAVASTASETVPSRDDVLEEAADICDQHLDEFSGTTCVYRCDVADAIRKLKSATTPQTAKGT